MPRKSIAGQAVKKRRPRDKKSQGHFSRSAFFSGLPSSGGRLAFQSSSREMILSFISLGDLSLPKILFQLRTIDDHLVYLLFSCDRILSITSPSEFAILVQLPHFLCLRQRGRGLLPLDGHGDIPLIFGAEPMRSPPPGRRPAFSRPPFSVNPGISSVRRIIPLHLLGVHAVAISHDLRGVFSGVSLSSSPGRQPWCSMASTPGFSVTAPFPWAKCAHGDGDCRSVMARMASSSVMLRTIHGIFANPASSLARWRRWPAMIS